MKPILTPEDKKYLKFFVKYLQSYGEKTGTFRFEDFGSGYDYEGGGDTLQLEENYYLEIPPTIVPIMDKIVRYCQQNIPEVDDDISSSSLEIMVDMDGSIGAEYCWRYYTVDGQNKSFDADDDGLSELFAELDEADLTGKIFVTFDGNGDGGSIEQAEDESGDMVSIGREMENWCYSVLEQYYGGWEINEGSSGKFIFDIENRNCELEFGWNNENTECDTVYEEKFDN